MKIYLRKDLNMRKGKISAQVSHAFMGIWLSLMKKIDNKYILEGENLEYYKENKKNNFPIEIIEVNSEEELLSYNKGTSMPIKDSGRTEFKEPTYTCLAKIEKELNQYEKFSEEKRKNVPIKQVMIANKDKKLNKLTLAPFSAICSWEAVANKMIEEDNRLILNLEKELEIQDWLSGGFAKITLKATEEEILDLMLELTTNNIISVIEKDLENFNILAIEPKKIETIDKYTSKFKLY